MGLIIEIAIVGAAAVMIWRGIRRQLSPKAPSRRPNGRGREITETLERDPVTGVYRPREPRE